MFLKVFRWVTIMFTALSMTPAVAHLLELPGKMTYTGALWLKLLQTLYTYFGKIGGLFEVGAVITSVILAILVRHRRPAFGWTLLAAACMVTAHLVYWILVNPVNRTMLPLTPETLPADWMRLRDLWEYAHAARAILQIVALGALVWSILAETPFEAPQGQPERF
jgi:hypothetical protein